EVAFPSEDEQPPGPAARDVEVHRRSVAEDLAVPRPEEPAAPDRPGAANVEGDVPPPRPGRDLLAVRRLLRAARGLAVRAARVHGAPDEQAREANAQVLGPRRPG